MQNPDPDLWVRFQQAVHDGQEGAVRRAFEVLFKGARGEMVRYAHWCVRRHNPGLVPGFLLDPDELVDDAFAELFLKCQKIEGHPKNWMLGVIRHKLAFRVAKGRTEDKLKREAQQRLNGSNKKCKSSVSREGRKALRDAINDLPGRMRAVIIALYYRRESVATTAKLLSIAENTVIQTKQRAIRKLRAVL